jgi:hypothetical protein
VMWGGGGGRGHAIAAPALRRSTICQQTTLTHHRVLSLTPPCREPDRTLIIGFIFIAVVLGFHFCGFLFK